jgi:octaprenyl-diphosphate synthase
MDVLTQIRKPIEREMADFESLFGITLQHQNALLTMALQHVLSRKGKLMRPILVLLAAKRYGKVNDAVLHAAVSLEMLHTASLVHDDVVDESGERRGQLSVNALMDNKAAVLVGDYLLSTSLKHAATAGSLEVVDIVARLGQTLSDGELQQLSNVKSDEISEEQYFDVIRSKTASLFASCAEVGALLSGATKAQIVRLRDFGTYVGLCFQIRDDVFDYYDVEVGKPTGNDMKEGKLTLPVIYAVLQPGAEKWHEIALKVRAGKATEDEIKNLVEFTKQSGGIDYARHKMDEIRNSALELLSDEGNDEVREALQLYLDFVLKRVS